MHDRLQQRWPSFDTLPAAEQLALIQDIRTRRERPLAAPRVRKTETSRGRAVIKAHKLLAKIVGDDDDDLDRLWRLMEPEHGQEEKGS